MQVELNVNNGTNGATANAYERDKMNRLLQEIMLYMSYSSENCYNSPVLVIFGYTLKYLDDNQEQLGIYIPEELSFEKLAVSMPDNVPYDSIKNYLTDIEHRMGISIGENRWFNELVRCGLKDNGDFLRALFQAINEMNFSGSEGRNLAYSAAQSIMQSIVKSSVASSAIDPNNMPAALLSLLDGISAITPDMSCYGITGDSCKTLSKLTCGKGCEVVVQTGEFSDMVLSYMLLIIACDPGRVKFVHSNIDWLPVSIGDRMGTFDRVYAFPATKARTDVHEILKQLRGVGDDFVEWWPKLPGSGEWIYARHMLKALAPNGIGYIIFPLGHLSRMGAYEEVRSMFLKENVIDAVIEFPPGTMMPTSGTKLAVLILKKNRNSTKIHLTNLGTAEAKKLVRIRKGTVELCDKERLSEIVLNRENVDGISKEVEAADIMENGCCLSPSAYIMEEFNFEKYSENFDMLMQEVDDLNKGFADADKAYEEAIRRLVEIL